MIRSTPAVRANDSWQLFLLALRYREGHLVTVGGNEPFLLRGDTAWIVYSGTVDLFVVALEDGEPTGRHEHFARLTADQLMMGLELDDSDVGLLAVCGPDTQLLRLAASRLKRFGQDLE